ncbi:MAG: protease modulator HflC [Rickettsiaceae bacterium]|nr:protease modulator HflC [Rickettsiaceae bacterium]
MRNIKLNLNVIVPSVVVVLIMLLSSLFVVDSREYAIVFQFGEAVRVVTKPGLKMKVPLVQNVIYYDNRILHVDAEAKELTSADGERVIVDAFGKFKIKDPVTFYKTVSNNYGASVRLNKIIESSMRKVIGRVPLTALLSEERGNIMQQISDITDEAARDFGLEMTDVRILRTDLPKENSSGIYSRMQTEREKEAKQIRAEGEEEAACIRAKADKEVQILLSESYKKAETIKGEGDYQAGKLYNEAYSKDPEFYKFYRSLIAYQNSLKKEDTSFVISPKSEFLKFLNIGK